MPPYPGIPYGQAPSWCFPLFECSMYLLFLICLVHAIKQGNRLVMYLIGGLVFGLLLEYMEVLTGSYTYGRFIAMLGKAPLDIPLCIGAGWGIIMYSARIFTDKLGLSLWACAALDTLLALNIDLSMDTVAYRLHMWHWDWSGTGLNPLTAQWFGIPYGNFIGWQTVVFCYSVFSRLFERVIMPNKAYVSKFILTTIIALLCSLLVLYSSETYLFPFLDSHLHTTSLIRFLVITIALLAVTLSRWRKRNVAVDNIPAVAWWIPGWFHLFFFSGFFLFGFYTENPWMTLAAVINLLIGLIIHFAPVSFSKKKAV